MKITPALLTLLAAAFLEGTDAAGTQEVVLIETKSSVSQETTERVSYQCTYRNLWTKERQPKNYPKENARWAGPIMWASTFQYRPWQVNYGVTRGVEKLIEEGFSDQLIIEFEQQGEQVKYWSDNPDAGFFTSDKDFVHLPPLGTEKQFPFMSVLAGMNPSPDWYTGFYSFWLIDDISDTYRDHIKIQTYPWDAGTDAGTTYQSLTADLEPQLEIQQFRKNNAPEGGELLGPDGDLPVVAEWECFLVVGEEDMILPDCDWFANPCCNETDKQNCGATLPNGALPSLTKEYAQVLENSDNSNGNSGAARLSLTALFAGAAMMQWILA